MFWFALASLTPAALLVGASLIGGLWSGAAIAAITVLVFVMDRLVARLMPDTQDRSGRALLLTLGAVHFGLWTLGIWALGQPGLLDSLDALLLVIGLGLYFGQISNSNAHELIHQPDRLARRLGVAIYGSLLFAHHTSAHLRVHHVLAATPDDPNTARAGEGFWRYLIRAWPAGFMAGKRAEDRLSRQTGRPLWRHPYAGYLALSTGACGLAVLLGGTRGLAGLLVIAAYAQVQLFLSDYVQHYGLTRARRGPGTYAPVGPEHSWNAPQWYSSAMMLNAPRHSDHHLHPARPYPALELDKAQMPVLPHSLPVMAVLALFPPIWRRVMDKRVARWRASEHNAARVPV